MHFMRGYHCGVSKRMNMQPKVWKVFRTNKAMSEIFLTLSWLASGSSCEQDPKDDRGWTNLPIIAS